MTVKLFALAAATFAYAPLALAMLHRAAPMFA
jgi:hypothetical protein